MWMGWSHWSAGIEAAAGGGGGSRNSESRGVTDTRELFHCSTSFFKWTRCDLTLFLEYVHCVRPLQDFYFHCVRDFFFSLAPGMMWIIVAFILAGTCPAGSWGCQLPHDWRPQTEACRAELAQIIVFAKVLALHKESYSVYNYLPWQYDTDLFFSAEIELLCDQAWGSMLEVPAGSRFNVTGLGYFPCFSYSVTKNNNYYFFLRWETKGICTYSRAMVQFYSLCKISFYLKRNICSFGLYQLARLCHTDFSPDRNWLHVLEHMNVILTYVEIF